MSTGKFLENQKWHTAAAISLRLNLNVYILAETFLGKKALGSTMK
jgi:hypothetical protein